MKKALCILFDEIRKQKLKANFCANVHDEIQIETVPEQAELIGQLAVDSIRKAGLYFELRCPLDGEYNVGINWSETH